MTPDPKHKRISLKRNGQQWKRLVRAIFERDGCCCRVCGLPLDETTLAPHHIKTVGSGGDDTPENLISVCKECHLKIHNGNVTRIDKEKP